MSEIVAWIEEREFLVSKGFVFHTWHDGQNREYIDVYHQGSVVARCAGETAFEVWDNAVSETKEYWETIRGPISLDELIGAYDACRT